MCPWCVIGRKRLGLALNEVKDQYEYRIVWEPFYLRPDLELKEPPLTKADVVPQYYGDNLGAKERSKYLYDAAKEVGFTMAPGNQTPCVPTQKAHRLIYLAGKQQQNKQDELSLELFNSLLSRGENIAKDEVLLKAAETVGIERSKVEEELKTPSQEVLAAVDSAEKQGRKKYKISGVPFFVITQENEGDHGAAEVLLSGAQEPSTFVSAFSKVTTTK